MTASSCASAAAGASAKQLALHRWTVGPCGRACTRSVSPSQSVSTEASASRWPDVSPLVHSRPRSEEHTSELQSLMSNSYAVFCLKNHTPKKHRNYYTVQHR